jgi:hypothetical protein
LSIKPAQIQSNYLNRTKSELNCRDVGLSCWEVNATMTK